MKLKLDFVTKVPKVAKDNEVILIKDKTTQNKMVKNMKAFIEDVFVNGSHMYDTDNIDRILAETDKCSSKWCQTCN